MLYRRRLMCCLFCVALGWIIIQPRVGAQSSSSSSRHTRKTATSNARELDGGRVSGGFYRNKVLGLACKIPEGWVLRTEEMNQRAGAADPQTPATDSSAAPASSEGAKVLLAAFSRPPEATGEDINASILIAAESVSAYPGLKDAAQYFDPLTEVAKAQGFAADEDPYEFAVGSKTLVRGDFHKAVGTRVMRQSTLAFLAHDYAVSITVIGGTEDELEQLLDGLAFFAQRK